MVELYNDGLVDLLKGKKDEEKPLTIKQDAKGIVFVQGATIQDCASLEDLVRFQQCDPPLHACIFCNIWSGTATASAMLLPPP
jgi:hypothetical protein